MTREQRQVAAITAVALVFGFVGGFTAAVVSVPVGLAILAIPLIGILVYRWWVIRHMADRFRRLYGGIQDPRLSAPVTALPVDLPIAFRFAELFNTNDLDGLIALTSPAFAYVSPTVNSRIARKRYKAALAVSARAFVASEMRIEEVVAEPGQNAEVWVRSRTHLQPKNDAPVEFECWERWTVSGDRALIDGIELVGIISIS